MTERHDTTLVLWDIDHTLIENAGVSKKNYADAFQLLTGRAPTTPPRTDGRTDITIMGGLLAANGIDVDAFDWDAQLAALVEAGARNGASLTLRGHVLPGAVECLSRLAGDAKVIQSVLTGNVEQNARVKLRAFGLDDWIDFSVGGFGADHAVRDRLVPIAQARATRAYRFDPEVHVTVLVGDTPRDVGAGLTGGARVIAVATGTSTAEELRAAGADAVLSDLADVDAFVAALLAVRGLGPSDLGLSRPEHRIGPR